MVLLIRRVPYKFISKDVLSPRQLEGHVCIMVMCIDVIDDFFFLV